MIVFNKNSNKKFYIIKKAFSIINLAILIEKKEFLNIIININYKKLIIYIVFLYIFNWKMHLFYKI